MVRVGSTGRLFLHFLHFHSLPFCVTWYGTQMATACLPGMLCGSFNDEDVAFVPDGYYSDYGFDLSPCEKGFICRQGSRSKCPVSFMCPNDAMSLPMRCDVRVAGVVVVPSRECRRWFRRPLLSATHGHCSLLCCFAKHLAAAMTRSWGLPAASAIL